GQSAGGAILDVSSCVPRAEPGRALCRRSRGHARRENCRVPAHAGTLRSAATSLHARPSYRDAFGGDHLRGPLRPGVGMKYIGRPLVHAAVLLLAISFLCFVLAQIAPGDFFNEMRLNPQISSQTIDHIRSEYGMDQPLLVRYERWLHSTFEGQMGFSFAYNGPVWPLLRVRARNTLVLTGTSTVLAWLIAIPVGVWSAEKRGTWGDRFVGLATSTLLTVPDLFIFLALLLLAVRTGWFPTGGM